MHLILIDAGGNSSLAARITLLLRDSAMQLTRCLRDPIQHPLLIEISSKHPRAPITLYRNSDREPIKILLSATEDFWCQYIFQFAHELCHAISNYEKLRASANAWLHESLCEIASLFVLRRMARQWLTSPTFPSRRDYAISLRNYAGERMQRPDSQLPPNMSLAEWVALKEAEFRVEAVTTPQQRSNQSRIANSLLPLFEAQPLGWNALTRLPASGSALREYLEEWHSLVVSEDKHFVWSIADALGQELQAR